MRVRGEGRGGRGFPGPDPAHPRRYIALTCTPACVYTERGGGRCAACAHSVNAEKEESTLTHRGPYSPPPPAEAPPPKLHLQEVCVFVFWMRMNTWGGVKFQKVTSFSAWCLAGWPLKH